MQARRIIDTTIRPKTTSPNRFQALLLRLLLLSIP